MINCLTVPSPQASCELLSGFLENTLNSYIANVTAAAMLCSEVLCQGNGRCVRKNYDSTHYLHLNSAHFNIQQLDGQYVANGRPARADLDAWAENFTCHCYAGSSCSPKLAYQDAEKRIQIQPPK